MRKRNPRILVGSILRMPNWDSCGGWRLWMATAHRMGGLSQESLWELIPIDRIPGDPELCQVPDIILETHPAVEVIDGEWFRDRYCGGTS